MKRSEHLWIKAVSFIMAALMLTACGSAPEYDMSYDNHDNGGMAEGGAAEETAPVEHYEPSQTQNESVMHDEYIEIWDDALAVPEVEDCMEELPNTEEYNYIRENGYVSVATSPLSTFSSDVDTASYTNVRRMIYDGVSVNPDAVRIEEMINYFDYGYVEPKEGEPFAIRTELSDCPWNKDTKLFMTSINTKTFDTVLSKRPASNLVFLIDVSGSMYSEDKLPLVQKSFSMLTENLTPRDRISIVTYAGVDAVLLDGADGNDNEKILDIINSLEAGGSTAGAAGINTAYEIAEKHFIDGGNNRIILATDGDLNVGISSEAELTRLVEEKRENGVSLSVLGFGSGNYKDDRLEALADNGNGNYSYIDSEREARNVLVDDMCGTLFTAAKDVKFQVEFNPAYVKGYRLVGYENRKMADEDFNDDTKDAGEVGVGHTVTVLYEIVPADSDMDIAESELKYSSNRTAHDTDELLTVNIRYKLPDGVESKLISYPVDKSLYNEKMSENMTFAAAVAEFGMLLRNSEYIGDISYSNIATQLSVYDYSYDDDKDEFIYLVNTMKRRA